MAMKRQPVYVRLGTKQRFRRLLSDGIQSVRLRAGLVRLRPGEAIGAHTTQGKEEAIVILEGSAKVVCEGSRPRTASQGTFVYIPPRTSHDVKNAGRRTLKYVYIVSRL